MHKSLSSTANDWCQRDLFAFVRERLLTSVDRTFCFDYSIFDLTMANLTSSTSFPNWQNHIHVHPNLSVLHQPDQRTECAAMTVNCWIHFVTMDRSSVACMNKINEWIVAASTAIALSFYPIPHKIQIKSICVHNNDEIIKQQEREKKTST